MSKIADAVNRAAIREALNYFGLIPAVGPWTEDARHHFKVIETALLAEQLADAAAVGLTWQEIQQKADGYLVVAQHVDSMGRAKGFDYDLYTDINDAIDMWVMLEDGEYRHLVPRAILPCKDGIPLSSTPLPSALVGRLVHEARKS